VETANVGKAFIIEGPKGPAGTVLQMHFANTMIKKKKKKGLRLTKLVCLKIKPI
jgi:hypothetical protein